MDTDPPRQHAEWKTLLPENQCIRVVDPTADDRWMVLPLRPAGAEGWDEQRLAALLDERHLIGVTVPAR